MLTNTKGKQNISHFLFSLLWKPPFSSNVLLSAPLSTRHCCHFIRNTPSKILGLEGHSRLFKGHGASESKAQVVSESPEILQECNQGPGESLLPWCYSFKSKLALWCHEKC